MDRDAVIHTAEVGPVEPPLPQIQLSAIQLHLLRAAADTGDKATVAVLSERAGCHSNSTRSHLDTLTNLGLLERQIAPAVGRGRPGYLYRPTEAGVATLRAKPIAPEYSGLALALADYILEVSPDVQIDARQAGRAWAAREPVSVPQTEDRGELAISLLSAMGFQPEAHVGISDTTIVLRACPLLTAALANPDVICNAHFGLLLGTLEAQGYSSTGIELLPRATPGGCIVRVEHI